jgi:hypothetical protein
MPYCSADAFTGNKTMGKINFNGRVFGRAGLDWLKKNVPKPEATLTAGCSAGSIGSLIWAPWVMNEYPNANNFHFSDSYVGVFGREQYEGGVKNWDMPHALPPFIPGLQKAASAWSEDVGGKIITLGANYFPKSHFSSYTSDADEVQTSYYKLGGGVGKDWTKKMREELSYVHNNTKNVGTYIANGNAHCRSQDDGFFTVKSHDVLLYKWFTNVVEGKALANVDCNEEVANKCALTEGAATKPLKPAEAAAVRLAAQMP